MGDGTERALGRIEGRLKGIETEQKRHGDKLDSMDDRMRGIEIKSAKYGLVSGGLMAVVMFIGGEFIKKKLGM